LLEAKTVESERHPLLWNSSTYTPVAGQWFGSHHMIAATDMYATIEQLEAVFSVRQSYDGY
jgi:hypothetical protein